MSGVPSRAPRRVRGWLAFTTLLAAAGLLHQAGFASLLGWAPRPFGEGPVPLLLVLLGLGHGAWLAASVGRRAQVLLALSLVCGLVACPLFTALGLAWALLYRRLLWSRAPSWVALAFPVVTLIAALAAADAAHFPTFAAAHPWTWEVAGLYALGWFLRALVLWNEARQGAACPGRIDVLVYFLFAPFVLIPPYMLALPRLALVSAGVARPDPAVVRSGLRWIAYGLGLQVVLAALDPLGLDPRELLLPALRARDWLTAAPLAVIYYPGRAVLDAVGRGALLLGLVRSFGVGMGPAFQAPLLARGVADWWRRYNTQFRDLLVDLFWYPVALRLRRRPVLAGYAGCAAVFLAGSVPLHWPKAAALAGTPFSFPWGVAGECLVMTVLVGTSLALERRRKRGGQARPARVWVHRGLTWVVVCAAVVGVDYQIDYRVRAAPWEALAARIDGVEHAAAADRAAGARDAAALVPGLAGLVAQLPRDPARRATLARALALAGDGTGAARQLRLARAFAPQPTFAEARAIHRAARLIPPEIPIDQGEHHE